MNPVQPVFIAGSLSAHAPCPKSVQLETTHIFGSQARPLEDVSPSGQGSIRPRDPPGGVRLGGILASELLIEEAPLPSRAKCGSELRTLLFIATRCLDRAQEELGLEGRLSCR